MVRFLPKIEKFGCQGLLAALALSIAVYWMAGFFPRTVAYGPKGDGYRREIPYGYSVQEYRWRSSGMRINLWARSGMTMSFDLEEHTLLAVRTQWWMRNDRAILLELDAREQVDSMTRKGRLALLFDFERGELHSYSDLGAWFVFKDRVRIGPKMTREEFDRLIHEYDPEYQAPPSPQR